MAIPVREMVGISLVIPIAMERGAVSTTFDFCLGWCSGIALQVSVTEGMDDYIVLWSDLRGLVTVVRVEGGGRGGGRVHL